eukprot:jgi/Botrbrau1/10115/Bobra.20_2s0022.1
MGIIFDEPKYPVIYKAPTVWQTVSNFSLGDYGWWAAAASISFPIGYFSGIKPKIPRQSMIAAGCLGLTAGFFLAYQQSTGRLMGLLPNDKEVEAYLKKQ